MSRLIDADKLEKQEYWGNERCFDYVDAEDIDNAPTVDAVPVVRCKDCTYYKESRVLAPNKFCFRLKHPTEPGKIGYNFADNDFCSRGVRRNEGADNG
jgi:hypothetical protein